MAKQFDAATDEGLRAGAAFKKGKVPPTALNALLGAIRDQQGVERGYLFSSPKEFPITTATSTAQVAKTGASRVYGFRAVSGSLKATPSTSTLDVVVAILDGAVTIGSGKLSSNGDCEVYFYGKDGIGIKALTNVSVKAFAIADGTGNPASGDQPDVVVLCS